VIGDGSEHEDSLDAMLSARHHRHVSITLQSVPTPPAAPSAPSAPSPTAVASRHHARGFWLVAFVFATTMAFAAAPAPLYVLYAREDGFGSFTVTVIFAAYAIGVAVSLYLAGHLSDRFGRRQVLLPAVLLNVVAAVMFLTWHQLGWLLAARFVSGLGIGILTATATAHLTELHRAARPGSSPQRAALVGTAANIGGIGLGPLVAGLLAEYAGRPLYTPYAVFAFLMLAGLLALVAVPETVAPAMDEWRYRPQRVTVPAEARAGFVAAAMLGFVSFAMFGFFTSLAPSFISGTLHHTSHALAGAISFAVFGSAAVAQVLTARWSPSRLYAVGLVVLPVGLVLVVSAILAASLALLVVAGVVVGAGAGTAFKAAVGSVIELAPPAARGETLAGLFLVGYLGMSVPVILLGVLLQYVAIHPSIIAFGALMLVLLAVAAVMVGGRRRPAMADV
jgi:MFS family permease